MLKHSRLRTLGSQKGRFSSSSLVFAKKNLLSFIGICFSLRKGSKAFAFCFNFITIIVLFAGAVTFLFVAFEVETDVDVVAFGFVFGKFLCRIAKAASFFFCFSSSSGVSGASCFAERSEMNYDMANVIQRSVYQYIRYS